jgi:hypothetical protein
VADHPVPNRVLKDLKFSGNLRVEKGFGMRELQESAWAQIQKN